MHVLTGSGVQPSLPWKALSMMITRIVPEDQISGFLFLFFNNLKTCVGNWLPDNLYTALGAFTPLFHATLHCSCVIFQEDFQPPVSMSPGRITSLFLLTHLYNHKTASKEALNLFVLGLQRYVPLSPPSSISLGRFGGAGTCSEV